MKAVLELARAELAAGVREVAGSGSNPRIMKYWVDAGVTGGTSDEIPWCAVFVGAMLKNAGMPNSGKANARSYLNWGTEIEKPYPGCVAIFTRGGSSWQGHVALFLRVDGDYIWVLGGNQSDCVCIAKYHKSRLLGYRHYVAPAEKPKKSEAEVARELKAAGSRTIANAENIGNTAKAALVAAPAGTAAVNVVTEVVKPYTDAVDELSSTVSAINTATSFLLGNWWVVGIIAGSVIIYSNRKIIQARVSDYLSGLHIGRR